MFDVSFIYKKIKKLFHFIKINKYNLYLKLQEGYPTETIVARFVGGCVRKYLSNEEVDDIDIATILSSDEIKEKFQNTNFKVVDTGFTHGT